MRKICPRCRSENRDDARFCALCGLSLLAERDGPLEAGRVRHPAPAPIPPGLNPVSDAVLLYFGWAPSLGGLTETESLTLRLFNAGYALQNVRLDVRGEGPDGRVVLARGYDVEHLPRAGEVSVGVPSYDIGGPLRVLRVALSSAEFAPDHDDPGTSKGG